MFGVLYRYSHADVENGEVDPEPGVPHPPRVDQVLLAAGVGPGAHIGHLRIIIDHNSSHLTLSYLITPGGRSGPSGRSGSCLTRGRRAPPELLPSENSLDEVNIQILQSNKNGV